MNDSLRIFLFFAILIYSFILFYLLKKRGMHLKYALLWIFTDIVMLVITIFPSIVYHISGLIGIQTPINALFVVAGMFAVLILLSITLIVSHLKNQIRSLTQSLGLLEERLRRLEQQIRRLENGSK